MKVAVVSYGMGNLGSVRRAFEELGADVHLAEHPGALFDAHRIVLPGVGAFAEGMAQLRSGGWVEALRRAVQDGGRPLLGICLGMQMLASIGEEGGSQPGLGLIDGCVRRLDQLGCTLRVPHVGWNEVRFLGDDPLFAHIAQRSDFYFVHSYAFEGSGCAAATAWTEYGTELVATIHSGHVFGTQFHPEKSSRAGRQVLRNFLECGPC